MQDRPRRSYMSRCYRRNMEKLLRRTMNPGVGQGYRGRVIWRRLDLVLTDRPSGSSLPFCPSRIWHRIIVPEYAPQPAAKSPCFIMLIFRFYLLYVFVLYNLALITLNTYTLILLHLIKKIQASHQVVDLNKQTKHK